MFPEHLPSSHSLRPWQPGTSAGKTAAVPFEDRLAVNQLTTLRSSLEQDLLEYREAGVKGIGLSCRKMYDLRPQEIVKLLSLSPLQVSSVGWIGCFMGYNGHRLPEVLQDAKQVIRLAGRLNAPTVTVLSGPLAGHIRSHAWRVLRDSLQQLLPLAEKCRVQLALTPMLPQFRAEWSFINQLDEALKLLDEVGHPLLKLNFSSFHSCHESGLLQRIPHFVDKIALVQLADGIKANKGYEKVIPGTGVISVDLIVHALEKAGYRGWYELDVWNRDLWQQPTAAIVASGKQALLQLDPQRRPLVVERPTALTDTTEFDLLSE